MLMFATTGYLSTTVKNLYNNLVYYLGTFTGLRGNVSDVSSVKLATPFGHGSIPPDGLPAILISINGSHKSNACLGYFMETPSTIPHVPIKGEGWLYSSNYLLIAQLNGLVAYKNSNNTYKATLPNGEFVGKMMLNRIEELERLIGELNTNYTTLKSAYDAHLHTGNGAGNPTSAPTTPAPLLTVSTPSTLAQDTGYINGEKYLINNNGELYGS